MIELDDIGSTLSNVAPYVMTYGPKVLDFLGGVWDWYQGFSDSTSEKRANVG